jgi:hypothetical protein
MVVNQNLTFLRLFCAHWEKVMSTRRLCKHIAKLLLSIDKQKATEVLRSLYEKEESWQLRIYPK